ncbi:MAG: hypothetical protein P8P74_15020 [Crocinitomicaceae bacterium]|nr:hypothetical protein [Crocinitomicaceae bacterium]
MIATLDGELSIRHRSVMTTTPILIGTALLSSITGFIVGFYELKKKRRRALFGIIGNLIFLIFYVIATIAIISAVQSFGPN